METSYDVVTVGETMVRLTPPDFQRIEQAHEFQVHIGGSESNTAVGLTRLGLNTCWVSRLTNNALGQQIVKTIAGYGVDTSHVVWTEQERVGLYFLEQGSPPRASSVIYDRANSAYSKFSFDDFPSHLLRSTRCLHVTGISLALGDTTRQMIYRAVDIARDSGATISFDINHRSLLWSYDQAREHYARLIKIADIVFLPRRDALGLWQIDPSTSDEQVLNVIHEQRQGSTTVMTLGSRGSIARWRSEVAYQETQPVPPVGRLGGGDAFSAGYLFGWLTFGDFAVALRWANAAAQLKYSIPGDIPTFTLAEVQQIADGQSAVSIKR